MPETRSITLRPVSPEDESFLLKLYTSTRADELALTNWDERQQQAFVEMQFAAQQQYYRTQFPEAVHSIILKDDRPAGRLYVARRPEEIRILDITVAVENRNAGVGSSILNELIQEAGKSETSVRIYVERFNPSLRLFERLGFSSIQDTPSHFLMEWRPTLRRST
ncbi:MAG TPA: GNAT family N-acetyltransferase [Blastocatellia bacterium]|nr:GNAT family N-acetyltransferase [Blastocatellia bacterium]